MAFEPVSVKDLMKDIYLLHKTAPALLANSDAIISGETRTLAIRLHIT